MAHLSTGMHGIQTSFERNRGRLVIAVVIVIGLYFIVAFGQQAWRARALESRVSEQQSEIATMVANKDKLQDQLSLYQSNQYQNYVQQIARRDLNLSQPGDTVIIPHFSAVPAPAATSTTHQSDTKAPPSNWRHWLNLFDIR